MRLLNYLFICSAACVSCATLETEDEVVQTYNEDTYSSTYEPLVSNPVYIRNATILSGTGAPPHKASILLKAGKILKIGDSPYPLPPDTMVFEGDGKWVTPGLIDVHSHIGISPVPRHEGNAEANERTNPNTAQVWAEHGIWTQDPQFTLALAGGVTTLHVLPGSANLFGGRSVTLKNLPARAVQAMKFPGAPQGLKMACGENPKRVYGDRNLAPMTRMGNIAGYRKAWIEAAEYKRKWEKTEQTKNTLRDGGSALRNLQLETLAEVLRGNILVHNHCYRADEMLVMLQIAREFKYRIAAFHHAVEAYKIADILAENDVCAAMWPDWWGFKHEAFDMVEENVALVDRAGACAIIHSDSALTIQHLNQEAAKVMAAANKAGLEVNRGQAIRWITFNAAVALGIADQVGSLEAGKIADLVIWDGDPFSIYSKTEKVFIDGVLVYDRFDNARQPTTDFDVGILNPEEERL